MLRFRSFYGPIQASSHRGPPHPAHARARPFSRHPQRSCPNAVPGAGFCKPLFSSMRRSHSHISPCGRSKLPQVRPGSLRLPMLTLTPAGRRAGGVAAAAMGTTNSGGQRVRRRGSDLVSRRRSHAHRGGRPAAGQVLESAVPDQPRRLAGPAFHGARSSSPLPSYCPSPPSWPCANACVDPSQVTNSPCLGRCLAAAGGSCGRPVRGGALCATPSPS
jgi:hypothetical protein